MRSLIPFVVVASLVAVVLPRALAESDAPENDADVRSILCGLPEEGLSCALLRFAPNWKGAEADTLKLVSAAHPAVMSSQFASLADDFDVGLDEVESLIWAGTRQTGIIGIATLTDQAAAERFAKAYVADPTSKKIGSRELLSSAKSGRGVCRFDRRRVAFGAAGELEKLLGPETPRRHPVLEPFFAAAGRASLLILDASPAALGLDENPAIATSPFAPLLKANRWRVSADIAEGLKFTLRAEFADAAATKVGGEVMPRVVQGLDSYFMLCEQMMPEVFERDPKNFPRGPEVIPYFKQAVAETRKGIAKSTTKTNGNDVETVIDVLTARPMTTAVMLLSLGPRPAKPKSDDK